MKLTPLEMRRLDCLAASTRRSDPGLYRALRNGTLAGYRWSTWRTIYLLGSIAMLGLAFIAGASVPSTLTWLLFVVLGSKLIRAQDRAEDAAALQRETARSPS